MTLSKIYKNYSKDYILSTKKGILTKKLFPANLFLILTALLFFLLRFYNIKNRISFDWDQETLAFQLLGIIRDHDLILIGHRATDAMGFYFGPYFEYLFVPFFVISRLHPIGFIPFLLTVNMIFFILTYYVLTRVFNREISIFFLFLWAVSPVMIGYDISVWAPVILPIGFILTIYLLWRIYKKPTKRNYIALGICAGFFTQIHSLYFLVDVYIGIFLLMHAYTKKLFNKDLFIKMFLMLGVFLVFVIPLILFDMRHDFLNAKLLVGYFTRRVQGDPNIRATLFVFSNYFRPFTYAIGYNIGAIIFSLMACLLGYMMMKKKDFYKVFYTSSFALLIITALIYMKYAERPSEYYFHYLYPFVALALIDFLYNANWKYLIILSFIFLMINIPHYTYTLQVHPVGLMVKEKVVLMLKEEIGSKPINITYEMPLGLNNGFAYLLQHHGVNVKNKESHPLVIIRHPTKKGDLIYKKIGIHIPEELTK